MSSKDTFTIGWVCALQEEYETACRMLDEEVDGPEESEINDNNTYVCGRINGHGVVIGCLPSYGTNAAACVARDMVRSFPNLRFALMVGIGGGAPTKDVRLGDVVVSMPQGKLGGVVQYDLGKSLSGGVFQRTGQLNSPPALLLGAIPEMIRRHNDPRKPDRIAEHLCLMDDMPDYQRPKEDRLYRANYRHAGGPDCRNCEANGLEERALRTTKRAVHTHYGTIASSNSVIKDPVLRDRYANDPELNVLCFETEAAGLMNNCPCLVIRGICDYADSHKNDDWHKYAALTAAAYARELLYLLKPERVKPLPSWESKIETINEIVSNTEKNVQKLTRREDREVLQWITPTDYGSQHSDNLRRREPGTGQWLFDSPEYQEWEKIPGRELFCPGIPGAGKTILASAIVDKLIGMYKDDPAVGVAFIYFNYKRVDEQTAIDLFSSLLKQLSQSRKSLPSIVQSLYDQHQRHQMRPSLEDILNATQLIVASYSRVFLIVDALDECEASHRRLKFISEISRLRKNGQVNSLVTSRFIPEIVECFKDTPHLEVRASNEDIRRYIGSQISRLPKFVADHPTLQEDIKTAVSDAVDGMFLLAQLYFDSIIGLDTATAIRDSLSMLVSGASSDVYNLAYDNAMDRIEGQVQGSRNRAKQVLKWISYARRPLTTLELQHALSVKCDDTAFDPDNLPDADILVSVCAGLVTIDQKSDIIRLVHYTTEEYFKKTKDRWFEDAELELAQICTSYLSFQAFSNGYARNDGDFERRLASYPFYDYAARNWGFHTCESNMASQTIISFLQRDAEVAASAQALFIMKYGNWDKNYSQRSANNLTGLQLAAHFGLVIYVQIMIDTDEVDVNDRNGYMALSLAAQNGHEAIVKLLLEVGAEIDLRDKDQRTPLLLAAQNGHEAIVKLLLEVGAEIDSRDEDQRNPLLYAARTGHEAIVKLLLEVGAEIDSRDEDQRTPLLYAARNGHKAIVKLLLEAGAEIDLRDEYRRTPLLYAAINGHEAIIKLLLEAGAGIDLRDEDQRTALSWAAINGHEAIVKLLLEAGAAALMVGNGGGGSSLA